MTKLSDTQAIILSEASRHAAMLASASKLPVAARQAVFRNMLKNLLLEEVPAPVEHSGLAWRQDDDGAPIALRITNDGLRAIDVEPEEPNDVGTEPPELTEAEEAEELALQQEALDAEDEAEEALEAADASKASSPRQGLRESAAAVVTAWEAKADLEAALTALKAALDRRSSARASGGPRKAREGTKQETVLRLLRQEEGATIAQVMEATGWQQHTVRGFFAGLKKKGLAIEVLDRAKQVGPNKQGAKGSYSVYRLAAPAAA